MFLIEYFWKTTKLSDIVGGQGSNDDQFCSAVLRKVALVILYVMFMFILDNPPPPQKKKQTKNRQHISLDLEAVVGDILERP